ncbi:MAG: MscL family protein [Bifidobacteriaceae bacterium]|jgi:large conductance mechanosensitive channel|nr:MscL family protein [Bifidobacteriaceae bacterium]
MEKAKNKILGFSHNAKISQIAKVPKINIFRGFKQFLENSDAISLAVGVVIGAAFKDLVLGVMNSLVYPLVAALFGHYDLGKTFVFTLGASQINLGLFLQVFLNFLLIMFAVYYFFIVPVNKLANLANVDIEISSNVKKKKTADLERIEKLLIENNRLLAQLVK